MKRIVDILVSLMLLLLLSPIVLIIGLLIRNKLGSPIFFKQERIGYKDKLFTVYKFRTMSDAHDAEGNLLPDSLRLTSFGKRIRRLSIDEIPQLLNVLKGEMSIVGPRPLLTKYLPYYTSRERQRHQVRPGITGLAQITGRNQLGWDERLEIDVKYVEKASFLFDLKIIFLTIVKVLRRENVVDAPGEQMLDFDLERQLKA